MVLRAPENGPKCIPLTPSLPQCTSGTFSHHPHLSRNLRKLTLSHPVSPFFKKAGYQIPLIFIAYPLSARPGAWQGEPMRNTQHACTYLKVFDCVSASFFSEITNPAYSPSTSSIRFLSWLTCTRPSGGSFCIISNWKLFLMFLLVAQAIWVRCPLEVLSCLRLPLKLTSCLNVSPLDFELLEDTVPVLSHSFHPLAVSGT